MRSLHCQCTRQEQLHSRKIRSLRHRSLLEYHTTQRQQSLSNSQRWPVSWQTSINTERAVALGVSTSQTDAAAASEESSVYRHGLSACQGSRDTMEDEVLVVTESLGGFFWAGVFDGHGGTESVKWISDKFYDIFTRVVTEKQLSEALAEHHEDKSKGLIRTPKLTALFTTFFLQLDQELLKHLKENGAGDPFAQSGATCTLAMVRNDCIVAANIGDSRAVISRNGVPVALTEEHRLYGRGAMVDEEIARVEAAGGWVVDGRVCNVLAVSRAFGDYEFKGPGLRHMLQTGVDTGMWTQEWANEQKFVSDPVTVDPQVSRIMVQPDDEFVIVATDGLWDVMPNSEVVRWVRGQLKQGLEPQAVADGLTNLALKRYTTDNVAVVLVDLQGPSYWRPSKPQKNKAPGLFSFLNFNKK